MRMQMSLVCLFLCMNLHGWLFNAAVDIRPQRLSTCGVAGSYETL